MAERMTVLPDRAEAEYCIEGQTVRNGARTLYLPRVTNHEIHLDCGTAMQSQRPRPSDWPETQAEGDAPR